MTERCVALNRGLAQRLRVRGEALKAIPPLRRGGARKSWYLRGAGLLRVLISLGLAVLGLPLVGVHGAASVGETLLISQQQWVLFEINMFSGDRASQ